MPQATKLGSALTASALKANPFSDEAQDLIENSWDQVQAEAEAALVDVLNRVLDRKRNTITIRVKVKRGQTGQQVFASTERAQYVNKKVANGAPLIPEGEEEVDFVFFKPGRRMSDAEVETERAKRGLVRDLEAQAAANSGDNLKFADEHPNGDSWKDADGNWCFAYFIRDGDERYVFVHQSVDGWVGGGWFGGVARKLPSAA
jgi:hypothetical protein